jgi:hypothetical protein
MSKHHDQLRAWAKGLYPTEAAVELLIRFADGRFAGTGYRWIEPDDYLGYVVDWEKLRDGAVSGPYSGGERRILGIVASLGSPYCQVSMHEATAGLGPHNGALVLAAISHALGSHEFGPEPIIDWDATGGSMVAGWTERTGALYPWPAARVVKEQTAPCALLRKSESG